MTIKSIKKQSQLLALIDQIYQAATDPNTWPEVCTQINALVESDITNLVMLDHRNLCSGIGASSEFSSEEMHAYFEKAAEGGVEGDIWMTRAQLAKPGQISVSEQLATEAELKDSKHYQEHLCHYNLRHAAGTVLYSSPLKSGVFSVQQTRQLGVVTAEQTALIAAIVPHLQRAFDIHDKLYHLKFEREASQFVFDKLAMGLVLLDAAGNLAYLNNSASMLIANNAYISIEGAKISVNHPKLRRQFSTYLKAAIEKNIDSFGGVIALPGTTQASLDEGLNIIVSRYAVGHGMEGFAATPIAVALILVKTKPASADALEILASLYQLTNKELEVLKLLCNGLDVSAIASTLSVTRDAIKYHLKNLFQKTGTSRQSELVRKAIEQLARLPL